jgi:hypothetical protein
LKFWNLENVIEIYCGLMWSARCRHFSKILDLPLRTRPSCNARKITALWN